MPHAQVPHPRSTSAPLALCPRCDWVIHLPHPEPKQQASCPRCGHQLTSGRAGSLSAMLAWALATLMLLLLVFGFDFLSFSTRGVGHTMTFVDAMSAFWGNGYPVLTILFVLTTIAFPGAYLLGLLYAGIAAATQRNLPLAVVCARLARLARGWMMCDVFIVGVLVALVKIVSLAAIDAGPSFVIFCVYALFLLKTSNSVDWPGLWDNLAGRSAPPAGLRAGQTGRSQHVLACTNCAHVFAQDNGSRCPRCGSRHWLQHISRLQLTWALLLTATLLYIPANALPIMRTHTLVGSSGHTIAGGVLQLISAGSWPIALVILGASIVVPLTKICALTWLCLCSQFDWQRDNRAQFRLFHFVERIGRWSMIDVFVVAILAALVQASPLLWIQPGSAILSFAAVVVLTMVAALTFDARLLWHDAPRNNA